MRLIESSALSMNKFITCCFLAISLLMVAACSNEIDTDAPEKEIMVVFGLLNPNDTIQHVRVHRAFLTNGLSALEVAKNPDKTFFDSLEVTIDEFDVGSSNPIFRASYTLYKNTSFPKDSGIFANESNIVYSLNQKLNQNYMYRITVKNKLTGNVATGETRMVHDPTLGSPSNITSLYLIDPARTLPITWTAGRNAQIYDLTMRFYWDEYDSATNQVIDSNVFIDWNLVQGKPTTISGLIRNNVPGINFYTFLASRLPYQVGKFRAPKKIDFIYWGADEEFDLYRKVNTPNIGIVQAKPEYTNISNGNFGLFASRNSFVIEDVSISDRTTEFLRTRSETRHLKFREP